MSFPRRRESPVKLTGFDSGELKPFTQKQTRWKRSSICISPTKLRKINRMPLLDRRRYFYGKIAAAQEIDNFTKLGISGDLLRKRPVQTPAGSGYLPFHPENTERKSMVNSHDCFS